MGFINEEMIVRNCLAIEKLFSKSVPKVTVLKYVLALLALKRASDLLREAQDIWDTIDETDEYSDELKKNGEDNIVLKHNFFVPESAYWGNFICPDGQIGDLLNKGFCELISSNKKHFTFNPFNQLDAEIIDFNSKLLGDLSQREHLLSDALHVISGLNIGNQGLESREVLDTAVDIIIDYYIGQNSELFVTPKCVTELLVGIAEPENSYILLPEAGEGKIIQTIFDSFRRRGLLKENSIFRVIVPDKCLFFIICMRAFLNEAMSMEILPGSLTLDSFSELKKKSGNKFSEFTYVLGSIPLEIQKRIETDHEYVEESPFSYGIPLNKKSEFSYLLGMLRNTVSGGSLIVAVPPQVLYKERSEGQIRKNLIRDDYLETVIQLPPKLYTQNTAAYAILVIRRFKEKEKKGKILFIDASKNFVEGKRKNDLSADAITDIVSLYNRFETVDEKAKIVSLNDVADSGYSLDVNRYINPIIRERNDVNLIEKLTLLKGSLKEKNDLIDVMIESIANLEKIHENVRSP